MDPMSVLYRAITHFTVFLTTSVCRLINSATVGVVMITHV